MQKWVIKTPLVLVSAVLLGSVAPQSALAAKLPFYNTEISLGNQQVSNPKHIVAPDPNSGTETSWLPVFYLKSALSQMNLQSTWSGSDWDITVPAGWEWDLSNLPEVHETTASEASISFNGKIVAYVPKKAYPDPASGEPTAYIPIFYVMNMIDRVGIGHSWDGSNWGMKIKSAPTTTGYTIFQLRKAYDVNPLYDLGYDGQGQSVAIVLPNFDSMAVINNVKQFSEMYHIAQPSVQVIHPDGATVSTSNTKKLDLEATEDATIIHGFAPGAKIIYVEDNNVTAAFQYILNNKVSSIVSYSANQPEPLWNSTGLQQTNTVLQNLAQNGVTILKGAGDWGAADVSSNSGNPSPWSSLSNPLNVNFPASSPWVTTLGGTSLTVNKDGTYSEESVWPLTGGGYSTIFQRPSWQQNSGISDSETMRGIPDAAFDADPKTGLIGAFNGKGAILAGDSATGPAWAAFIALADQVNGKPLGFINPMLYQIGNSANYHLAFHDVASGSNGYKAGANWDPATGLGSPDVYHLVQGLTVGFSSNILPAQGDSAQ